ncbi:SDR family oxidoreductase [Providencia vermicola]|uniref:SDR family oxidoreductase n=1 Tax=Providencia TaxID=586 RepID=UPI0012B64BCE|nr:MULTISPECIES: SDR family oxidoreductase [Providencia]ELR5141719.1 SDR family oxidoreductase [Providencia stuartii]MTB39351.1 NAD(P)H-binding protein [Providencia sp. wls1949]QIC16090.1 SDR family oxidoreductase [Providencia vermicola]WER20502.1 SDR family oxidoreductase [Providencia stuartii]WER24620.1 SDR family oxidoreductase [Providencia stuartii]
MKNRILVTGATGQVGHYLVRSLQAQGHEDVVLAVRNPAKLTHSPYPIVEMDYDKPKTIEVALSGVNSVFMMTGYTIDMLQQSKVFVDIAKKSGVNYIVHLGACGDDEAQVAHWAWHQLVERYIEWSGIQYTHLRPESYMQNLLGYQGEDNINKGVLHSYFGDAILSWVDCADVAELAAYCLLSPEQHAGQVYRLGYENKNYTQIAELLTTELGIPFHYQADDPDEFWQFAQTNSLELAYMKSIYDHYVAFTSGKLSREGMIFDNFQKITGKAPTTLKQFLIKHQNHFKP